MRASVFIDLFRQNSVFTSLRLRSPIHVVPPLGTCHLVIKVLFLCLFTAETVHTSIIL
jgi:hypothetical protein